MSQAIAQWKNKLVLDVFEKLISVETVLVSICFKYCVNCGNWFVGNSRKLSQGAPDQVYNNVMHEDQIMQVLFDAFVANYGGYNFKPCEHVFTAASCSKEEEA